MKADGLGINGCDSDFRKVGFIGVEIETVEGNSVISFSTDVCFLRDCLLF